MNTGRGSRTTRRTGEVSVHGAPHDENVTRQWQVGEQFCRGLTASRSYLTLSKFVLDKNCPLNSSSIGL